MKSKEHDSVLDTYVTHIFSQLLQPDNNVFVGDAVMVTGSDGIVKFVSDTYHIRFNIPKGYCEGKSIRSLAEEGIFSPCVTEMVLEQKKKISIMEYTRAREPVHTIGIPIFDADGNILYAICFNSMELTQLENIQYRFAQLQAALNDAGDASHDKIGPAASEAKHSGMMEDLVVQSPVMKDVWRTMKNYAVTKANILILGETGVGKSRLAKAIHDTSSYADGPFVEVNCAAIPDNLIESELFGYDKGAFTGADPKGKMGKIEMANHGTLFLDEVGELSLAAQAALLHVIQNKLLCRVGSNRTIHVDFRLVTATNQNLKEAVKAKRFRSDLYYRLNVLRLVLPPLRERKEDIIPIAIHFLKIFNDEYHKQVRFSPKLLELLKESYWPGNIREIENFVERLVIMGTGEQINWGTKSLMPGDAENENMIDAGADKNGMETFSLSLKEQVENLESKLIRSAYEQCGTSTGVAKMLKISQPTAIRKIHKYIGKHVVE